MTQNRPPPAFQEYASGMMARTHYRLLSLPGRGLLYSMRLECWVNHALPEGAHELAKLLGYDTAEVKAALPSVLPFFAVKDGLITCPELEDYRAHLDGVRAKQAAGGKKGADKTNAKHKTPRAKAEQGIESGSGNSQVPRPLTRGSLVQSSTVKSSTTQSLKEGFSSDIDSFVADMERAEGKDPFTAYERASNGH